MSAPIYGGTSAPASLGAANLPSTALPPPISPIAFFSPIYFSLVIQLLETGVLINQAYLYFTRCRNDRVLLVSAASFVFILGMFQSASMVWYMWAILVQEYGNMAVSTRVTWQVLVQPLLTASMGAPLQSFMIYRCCKFMDLRWFYAAPLVAVLFVAYVAALVDSVKMLMFNLNTPPSANSTEPAFLTWLYASAVLDIMITIGLLVHLLRHKAKVSCPRLNRLLIRVVNITWETALPPCIVAITVCILHQFNTGVTFSLSVAAIYILGKLYALSLFFILNFRCDVHAERPTTGDVAIDISNLSIRRPMDASIHVNIHTVKRSEQDYIDLEVADGDLFERTRPSTPKKTSWASGRGQGTWDSKVGSDIHFED